MITSRPKISSEREIIIGLLTIPVMSPQTTVCNAKAQKLFGPVETSVQVTDVLSVALGQFLQFDDKML